MPHIVTMVDNTWYHYMRVKLKKYLGIKIGSLALHIESNSIKLLKVQSLEFRHDFLLDFMSNFIYLINYWEIERMELKWCCRGKNESKSEFKRTLYDKNVGCKEVRIS